MKPLASSITFALGLLPLAASASILATWNFESEPTGSTYGGDNWNGTAGTATPHTAFAPFSTTANLPTVQAISPSGAAQTGLTQAVNNNPGDTRKFTGTSFQDAAYGSPNITASDASFQLLLSPDNFTRRDQVVFETGGNGAGTGLILSNNTLRLGVATNAGTATSVVLDLISIYEPVPDFSDYLEITIAIDLSNGIIGLGAMNLGTGLGAEIRGAFTGNDWAGSDQTGIFQAQGTLGADAGNNLTQHRIGGGWQNYDGQLAQIQVFDEVLPIPEPGRAALVGFALGALALRRRR